MAPILLVFIVLLSVLLIGTWIRLQNARRAEFIRTFPFPKGLYERLQKRRPQLTLKDSQLVGHALRQFFLAYRAGGRRFLSMPSQLADDLWHEFILYTKNYQHFCRHAFGGFLHHTPAIALGTNRDANLGLGRCWSLCCREENINPRKPTRLPLLFALDAKFAIDDGFHYVPDCGSVKRQSDPDPSAQSRVVHCGADLHTALMSARADGGSGCGGGGDAGSGPGHDGHGGHAGEGGGCSGHGGGGHGCSGGSCGGGGCGGGH